MSPFEPRLLHDPTEALEILDGLEAVTRESLRAMSAPAVAQAPAPTPAPAASLATRPKAAPEARTQWTCRDEYRPALSNPALLRALRGLRAPTKPNPPARSHASLAARPQPAAPRETILPGFAHARLPEVDVVPKSTPLRADTTRLAAHAQSLLRPTAAELQRQRNLAVAAKPPNLP